MTHLRYLLLIALGGCSLYGGDDDAPPEDVWLGEDLPACDLDRRAFRIDAVTLPVNSSVAEDLGWDLDGDLTIDNQGGNIISALISALGTDLQTAVDEVFAADLVQIGVTMDECASPAYGLVEFARGLELDRGYEPPRLLGDDVTSFAAVAVTGLPDVALDGTAQFPVGQLVHPSADAWIDAFEVVVVIDELSDDEVVGRIATALDGDAAYDVITEAFTAKMADRIEELGPCTPEACDDLVRSMLELFDDDLDGAISLEEVRSESLVASLLRADVDVDQDGQEDALSIGVGFHASRVDLYLR